jgi:lipoate-protein ligase A
VILSGPAHTEQEELQDALQAGITAPVVKCWHYPTPGIVLGRSQRPTPGLRDRAAHEGIDVVSRSSGGGAVIAGPWMLSATLLVPVAHPLARASLPAGYRAVGEACLRALSRFGVRAQLCSPRAAVTSTDAGAGDELAWVCFAGLSHGELVVAGERKVVGLSQVRRRGGVAFCMGVLLARPDWELLLRAWLGRADLLLVRQLESRTASCAEFAPVLDVSTVDALADELVAELPALALAA